MYANYPSFVLRVALLMVLCVSVIRCDTGIRIENVAPSVTALGPLTQQPDGDVQMYLWVRDYEKDPVDALFTLINNDGTEVPLAITGGHLAVGLTTSAEATGAPHELVWTPPENLVEPIQIRVVVQDWHGLDSVEHQTPSFFIADGLPTP